MLGHLIKILRDADGSKIVPLGFDDAFSYRGDYAQLGVRRAASVSVATMLEVLEGALDRTMHGYKGGEYVMHDYVDVYLVDDHSSCGEQLGPTFMQTLLASARTSTVKP